MKYFSRGACVKVLAFKHDGSFHRCWKNLYVVVHNPKHLVLYNCRALVIEKNGRKWKSYNPALWFFSSDRWSNTLASKKDKGLIYYTNLASPYLVKKGIIQFIDYDLDVKVAQNGQYRLIDMKDFLNNGKKWEYPDEVINAVHNEYDRLIKSIVKRSGVFNWTLVRKYFRTYYLYQASKKHKLNNNKEFIN